MTKKYIDADMAISALDRAVCDYCVCPCDKPYSKKCNAVDNYSAGIRVIEDLPTADVRENVHGEWIRIYSGNYKCSSCGDWWGWDGDGENEMIQDFKYCPNCGSRMKGIKDE